MSLKKIFYIIFSSIAFLIIIQTVVALLLVDNQNKLSQSHFNRFKSYLLADELRQSSDDLTRLARTYVVTGDPKWEKQYWNVLDIRNGKKPRPKEYHKIYWDFMAVKAEKPRPDGETKPLQQLMKEAGFTGDEFAKLKEAEANSNSLVTTETIAMNAIKGLYDDGTGKYTKKADPNPEMARQIMHDNKYHQDKYIIMKPIEEFFDKMDNRTKDKVDKYTQITETFLYLLIGLSIAFVFAIIFGMFFIVRYVTKPLNKVSDDLTNSSRLVSSKSDLLANNSQKLAEGASEQASSLEETSASLEELAAMTQNNMEIAIKANDIVEETYKIAEKANNSMNELMTSIKDITQSSEESGKIIKVIDEIAFQTNLLALNAAVEAARAGDAGMGFAVVADEVRNLAQRSAEAAKNTSELIEKSINNIKEGYKLTQETEKDFSEVVNIINKLKELIGEVSAASKEQASGIDQVSATAQQMTEVTQSNAANSEESAAASEDLNNQAKTMIDVVEILNKLVGKKNHDTLVAKQITNNMFNQPHTESDKGIRLLEIEHKIPLRKKNVHFNNDITEHLFKDYSHKEKNS